MLGGDGNNTSALTYNIGFVVYTLNNISSLEGTLQYNHHATPGEPLQGSLGLHCTEGFFLKNLYCLECRDSIIKGALMEKSMVRSK